MNTLQILTKEELEQYKQRRSGPNGWRPSDFNPETKEAYSNPPVRKTLYCRGRGKRYELERTYGNCLEGLGIPNKATIFFDRHAEPVVGDLVYCNNVMIAIGGYLKQVIETGDVVKVGTAYAIPEHDYWFKAQEIYGVVVFAFDEDGNTVYDRNDTAHTEQLSKPTAV